jgi:hypothetical protein
MAKKHLPFLDYVPPSNFHLQGVPGPSAAFDYTRVTLILFDRLVALERPLFFMSNS